MTDKKRSNQSTKAERSTFKDRLRLLIGNDRPYSWCRKVGIEKGLFQYYWQKEKIPKYDNLIKIRNYTGCSLDWLLTNEGEPFLDRIEDVGIASKAMLDQIDVQITRTERHVSRLKKARADLRSIAGRPSR